MNATCFQPSTAMTNKNNDFFIQFLHSRESVDLSYIWLSICGSQKTFESCSQSITSLHINWVESSFFLQSSRNNDDDTKSCMARGYNNNHTVVVSHKTFGLRRFSSIQRIHSFMTGRVKVDLASIVVLQRFLELVRPRVGGRLWAAGTMLNLSRRNGNPVTFPFPPAPFCGGAPWRRGFSALLFPPPFGVVGVVVEGYVHGVGVFYLGHPPVEDPREGGQESGMIDFIGPISSDISGHSCNRIIRLIHDILLNYVNDGRCPSNNVVKILIVPLLMYKTIRV